MIVRVRDTHGNYPVVIEAAAAIWTNPKTLKVYLTHGDEEEPFVPHLNEGDEVTCFTDQGVVVSSQLV